MIKVVRSEDCGNSPKNLFIQELAIAFAKHDVEFILSSVSDDIYWHIVGGNHIQGKAGLAELIRSQDATELAMITIHHVVTHGKAGSVNGTMKFKDGRSREFCDVYEFTNAKGASVQAITSYVIEGRRDHQDDGRHPQPAAARSGST